MKADLTPPEAMSSLESYKLERVENAGHYHITPCTAWITLVFTNKKCEN